jgi:hypothetical protein
MTTPTLVSRDELRLLPQFYETHFIDRLDMRVAIKLHIPQSQWAWYIIESDGTDRCFGLVVGIRNEFGYFSISELSIPTNPAGQLVVERDTAFVPCKVSELLS